MGNLRPYQQKCVDAVFRHMSTERSNPAIVVPTGGGKSHIIAYLAMAAFDVGSLVLILAHVKELLQQIEEKIADLNIPVGVYSAGLDRREIRQVTIAGIQSAYKKPELFGRVDLVMVDECHLINPDGEGSMYAQLLGKLRERNEGLRVIGFTATPYRMKSGYICSEDHWLNEIAYEAHVPDLISAGYLSPLKSKDAESKADISQVKVSGGEYVGSDLDKALRPVDVVRAAVAEIKQRAADRKSILIFCAGVKHAEEVQRQIDGAELITGGTSAEDRADIIERFREGRIRHLINVNVLTTGFDAPNVDCVVLLRPTLSPGLYCQMVGRGFRLSPETGKKDCLILDFGENIRLHGPVDQVKIAPRIGKGGGGEAPWKACPECRSIVAASSMVCDDCQYEWPELDPGDIHQATADDAPILSGQAEDQIKTHHVNKVRYGYHLKKGSDVPTMRVDYEFGLWQSVSEYVAIQHGGWAKAFADAWWRERCDVPPPDSVGSALRLQFHLRRPEVISVDYSSKYPKVVSVVRWGPVPDAPVKGGDGNTQQEPESDEDKAIQWLKDCDAMDLIDEGGLQDELPETQGVVR